jgi:hypothetical protein
MVLKRGEPTLEFFRPDVNPLTSWFGCCLRLDELDGFYEVQGGRHPGRADGPASSASACDPALGRAMAALIVQN